MIQVTIVVIRFFFNKPSALLFIMLLIFQPTTRHPGPPVRLPRIWSHPSTQSQAPPGFSLCWMSLGLAIWIYGFANPSTRMRNSSSLPHENPAHLEPALHLQSGYFQTVSVALVKQILIAIIDTSVVTVLLRPHQRTNKLQQSQGQLEVRAWRATRLLVIQ